MEKCFDEVTLQAFLDNELNNDDSRRVARHLADCDTCAELLAVVEEETAFVFGALEPEVNVLVPTQRLWDNITKAISGERLGWLSSIKVLLAHVSMPTMAAFASIVFIAAAFAFFLSNQPDPAMVALGTRLGPAVIGPVSASPRGDEVVERVTPAPEEIRAVRADLVRREPTRVAADRDFAVRVRAIDGEAQYVQTISKLERSVNDNKDALLSPSARFEYEKNLAVINDAIRRTRDEVRRDPKSGIARQVLFNSYQNKIDLLNSVNERGVLMASIR